MPLLIAVIDASVIVGTAKGGIFQHLRALYRPLYVPRAVCEEIIQQGRGRPGSRELTQARGVWITEIAPDPGALHPFAALRSVADREVLAIAHDPTRAIDHLLSDDDRLLRRAARPGLFCLRTPEVVLLMKRQGLIPEVKAVLDQMRREGFGIDEALYQGTVRAAGE